MKSELWLRKSPPPTPVPYGRLGLPQYSYGPVLAYEGRATRESNKGVTAKLE